VGTSSFRVALIKPSHYDADGYVIQWWRSFIPSNSLASVYGLVAECARERVLGADVNIEIETYDEWNTVIDVRAVAPAVRDRRPRGLARSRRLWPRAFGPCRISD
jgi:hypothetical protein